MTTYLSDTFDRTVAPGGWGTPSFGPAYTISSTYKNLCSVNGTQGIFSPVAPVNGGVTIPVGSVLSLRLQSNFTFGELPVGGNNAMRFRLREPVVGTDYHIRITCRESDSRIAVNVARNDAAFVGGTVYLATNYTPNARLSIIADCFGTDPTRIRAKVWYTDTEAEPVEWTIDRSDFTVGYQLPGPPSLTLTIGSGVVNATSIVFRFDDLNITDVPSDIILPVKHASVPVFGSNSFTVGGAFNAGGTIYQAKAYIGTALVATQNFTINPTSLWGYASFSGLLTDTTYNVKIFVDGSEQTNIPPMSIRTLPTTPTSFKFVAGSCQLTSSNHPVFDRIRDVNPRFFAHMGDIHYGDATTYTAWKSAYEASMAMERFRNMTATVPMNWSMDNHDRIITNPTGTGTGLNLGETDPQTAATYKHYAGNSGWATSDTLGRTWTVGRVRFIQLDMWSVRDDGDGDPAPRTFLGPTQKQWFKDTLTAATEPVIIWFCNWTGLNNANGRWNSFPEETTELEAFIDARPAIKSKMILCGGDSHSLQADSGARSGTSFRFKGIPSLNMSGLNRSGDAGDGNVGWDIANAGMRTTAQPEADWGGYSRFTVTDSGGDSVVVGWEAVRVDPVGVEDVMASFTKEFAATALVGYDTPFVGVKKIKSGTGSVSRLYHNGHLLWDESVDIFTYSFPMDGTHEAQHEVLAANINDLDERQTALDPRSKLVIANSLTALPAGIAVGSTLVIR